MIEAFPETEAVHQCCICKGATFPLIDLGRQPLANGVTASAAAADAAPAFPLDVIVCRECSLAQLNHRVDENILYSEYNYITPDSSDLTRHYGQIKDFLSNCGFLGSESRVLDIGSNIGRLLEYLKPHVASILGIDPAQNIARMANEKGIPTLATFFNKTTAREIREERGEVDAVFIRHCFAHNPDPSVMSAGFPEVLSKEGILVIENAYFLDTVERGEFDQIYHEHMYYYNVRSISRILKDLGMRVVDLYHSDVHGGTMVFVAKFNESSTPPSARVAEFLEKEKAMHTKAFYEDFLTRIASNRTELISLVNRLHSEGKTVHAYGASAKATVLLNYYGLTREKIPCIVDSTITKQGKFVPGTGNQIISEEDAAENLPDYYLLTIWNYKDEIIRKVRATGNSATRFIVPHPAVEVI